MRTTAEIRGRILVWSRKNMFLARGHRILKSSDNGKSWQAYITLPSTLTERLVMKSDVLSRLFRKEINHLVFSRERIYLFAKKSLYVYMALRDGTMHLEKMYNLGYRPLSVAYDGRSVWFGEYLDNPDRNPVKLIKICDGVLSEQASLENIRHIHGVFWDEYENQIWLTTGDADSESKIWVIDNEGPKEVLGGAQRFRAVELLFDKNYIYYGTDTPTERNSIFRISRHNHSVRKCCDVGSSVFYGVKAGKKFVFGTVIEPSSVNLTRYAEIWTGADESWQCVKKEKKDNLPMKYFQYGQFQFVACATETDAEQPAEIWIYLKGLKGSGISRKLLIK